MINGNSSISWIQTMDKMQKSLIGMSYIYIDKTATNLKSQLLFGSQLHVTFLDASVHLRRFHIDCRYALFGIIPGRLQRSDLDHDENDYSISNNDYCGDQIGIDYHVPFTSSSRGRVD